MKSIIKENLCSRYGRPIKILNLAKKCNFFGYKLVEQKKTNFKNEILLKIIGLGNGEKIKEKLLEKNESFEKSSHPLIFRVANKFNRKVKIIDICNKILEECEKNNINNLQKILKKSPFYYKNKIRSIWESYSPPDILIIWLVINFFSSLKKSLM